MDPLLQNATYTFGLNVRPLMASGNHVTTYMPVALTTFLLYLATNGDTRSELRNVFKLDTKLANNDGLLLKDLETFSRLTINASANPALTSSQYRFDIFSKIYVHEKYALKEDFVTSVSDKFFNTSVESVPDFTDCTRQMINDWVAEATHGKVADLLPPLKMNDKMSMVMVTALYLKLGWAKLFPTSETKRGVFTQSDGKNVSTYFIGYRDPLQLRYLETPDLQYVEIPLKNSKWLAFIVMPRGKLTIDALWQSRTVPSARALQTAAKLTDVRIRFPKFSIDSTEDYVDMLKKLGVTKIFTPQADFSKLTSTPGLSLSDITTRSIMTVNEDGVEMAATGTALGAGIQLGGGGGDTKYVAFTANRPFMFAVVNNVSPTAADFDFGLLVGARIETFS